MEENKDDYLSRKGYFGAGQRRAQLGLFLSLLQLDGFVEPDHLLFLLELQLFEHILVFEHDCLVLLLLLSVSFLVGQVDSLLQGTQLVFLLLFKKVEVRLAF